MRRPLNQAIPHIYDGLAAMFGEDHVHVCWGWDTKAFRDTHAISKTHTGNAVCVAALGAGIGGITQTAHPL